MRVGWMQSDLGRSFGAIRWTHHLKLGAHMLEAKSSSLFPSSAGAACKTTAILGLVLKADKPCVGLWTLRLARVELDIVPVA